MTTRELLEELQRRKVHIAADGGRLKVNAPKGVLTPDLHEQLTKNKTELLALLETSARAPRPPLVRIAREGLMPASSMQERLWYIHQMDPSSAAYNVIAAFRVQQELNRSAIETAWRQLSERHEILRTAIVAIDGRPMQDITSECAEIAWRDLSDLPRGDRDPACRRCLEEEAAKPFQLDRAPLARVLIVRLDDAEYVLLLTLHHAIADQWSLGVLFEEWSALYRAAETGATAALPPLPVQYADYADWQRRWLAGPEWVRQLAYWKRRLDGLTPLELVTDFPRSAVQTSRGALVWARLPPATRDAVETIARSVNTTSSTVLLAAFAMLLRRSGAQSHFAIGMPVASRDDAALDRVVGALINTLVVTVEIESNPTLVELIDRIRTVLLEAQENRDAPFERLIAELHPARSTSHPPLVQVMFNVLNADVRRETVGWSLTPLAIDRHAAQMDLTLSVDAASGGLFAEYNADLFEEDTARRMLARYGRILDAMLAAPGDRVDDVDLLGADERAQLAAWNGTSVEYDLEEGVETLVSRQAGHSPDAVAINAGGLSLTYAELDRRSGHFAAYLHQMGVGVQSLVGICLDRTPDLVVSLLGVLKAGAAYVPLDPAFPAQRLAIMVEDAGLAVVVTDDASEASVPPSRAPLVRIDRDWPAIAAAPDPGLTVFPGGKGLAYVLYTSGSTGRPKGVQVPRRALTNFIRSMQSSPGMGPADVLLAVTTLSFDIAGLEIFLPLTVGGTVVLASRGEATDGVALGALIQATGATIMQATPATWRLLLDAGWQGSPGLKILCGGEAFPPDLAEQLLSRCDSLWNLYGPTETTIWSTLARVDRNERLTIGRPIANTQVHVVDSSLRLLPVGVPGELCIGGAGVALGYLGRPELTSDRFVADPFSKVAGARMYRTGDLGRWLSDGTLQYLGRLDSQVKVRGFRVELGEIEAVLERHPSVKQAVVTVHDDSVAQRRLIAYVVNNPDQTPTPSEYRRFLRQELPEYMIPSLFLSLDRLPLTPNGKVDRRALPSPYEEDTGADRVPPRTETERTLAEIWSTLLTSEVSVHDNFFEIGGHSLLSMQAIARVQERLGVRLTPNHFIVSTLEQIAAECDRLRNQAEAAVVETGERQSVLQSLKSTIFGRRAPKASVPHS